MANGSKKPKAIFNSEILTCYEKNLKYTKAIASYPTEQ